MGRAAGDGREGRRSGHDDRRRIDRGQTDAELSFGAVARFFAFAARRCALLRLAILQAAGQVLGVEEVEGGLQKRSSILHAGEF